MKKQVVAFACFAAAVFGVILFASHRRSAAPVQTPVAQAQSPRCQSAAPAEPMAPAAAATEPGARTPDVSQADCDRVLAGIPEGPFRESLMRLDAPTRRRALTKLIQVDSPKQAYASLRADLSGALYYVCAAPAIPPEETQAAVTDADGAATATAEVAKASVPITSPPLRHSRPGATRVVYLDFNGHTVTGTGWNDSNSVTTYQALPYDTDGDATTFSDAEQAVILQVWERVAEDYAPFDIDVTTEEPATFTRYTGRVLITKNVDAAGVSMPSSDAGGVAYMDVFGDATYVTRYSPAFVYYNNLAGGRNAGYIAEGASHEFGHNAGLDHDGQGETEYYSGHGSGYISWAPIMGTGYSKNVTQWSKGEYYNASNTEDDVAILTTAFGLRADDVGGIIGAASALTLSSGAATVGGVFTSRSDVDVFSVSLGSGDVSLSVVGYRASSNTRGGNTDVLLELLNSSGTVVASSDPASDTGASLTYTATAGTYYVRLTPMGAGTPMASVPTGYTSYGSIGQYTLTVSSAAPVTPSFTTHPASQSVNSGSSVTFIAAANGYPSPAYQWYKGVSSLSGATNATYNISSTVLSDAGSYTVVATNSAGSATSNAAVLTILEAPSFTVQPASQTIVAGNSVTFTATATGGPAPAYQWYKDGTAISGATGSSYTIGTVATSHAGSYTVVAANSVASATSSAAVLTVHVGPAITTQPASQSVVVGASVTFNVVATGTPVPAFQWLKGGVAIPQATASSYAISSVALADAGSYTVNVSNAVASVTSDAALLAVSASVSPPVVTSATLAGGAVGEPFQYQIDAQNSPTSFAATGLPSSLSINTTSGLISGMPTAAGSHTVTLGATNAAGTGTATLSLVVTGRCYAVTLTGKAGTAGSLDATGTNATFDGPADVAANSSGVLYVADAGNHSIRSIALSGAVTTFAGLADVSGSTDATGTAARFNNPTGVAVAGDGTVYVADTGNHVIRRITSVGVVSTFAGTAGQSGTTDATGAAARFNAPSDLAFDSTGSLYVADTGNHTIRMITSAGVVTTVAGQAGSAGTADGTGTTARFGSPSDVVAASGGVLYVADSNNRTIRKVTISGSTVAVTTLAGTAGVSGSVDGVGTSARFNNVSGLALGGDGDLYLTDTGNQVVRRIAPATGLVITLAGSAGTSGTADGYGAGARFTNPLGIAAGSGGELYVADSGSPTIRELGFFDSAGITTQPLSQTVTVGSGATFTVVATGSPTPVYQWYKDGAAVSGATSSTLALSNVQSTAAGSYTVAVSNVLGSTTSSAATLTVNAVSSSGSTSSSGSGGGGGGGGAPGPWYLAALALAWLFRRRGR